MKNVIFYINLIVALLCSCTDMPDEFYWKVNHIRTFNAYRSDDPKHVSVRFNLDVPLEASAEEELTEAYLIVGNHERGEEIDLMHIELMDILDHWKGGTVPISVELPYHIQGIENHYEDTYFYIHLASLHCYFDNDGKYIFKTSVPDIMNYVELQWLEVTDITSSSAKLNIRYKNPKQVAWEENESFVVYLSNHTYREWDQKVEIPFPKINQEQSEGILSAVINDLKPDSRYSAKFYRKVQKPFGNSGYSINSEPKEITFRTK